MSPDHQALVSAPIPRPRELVQPYVTRATKWIRAMVYIFVGIFVGVALLSGTLDMLGGHSTPWWMSYVKGFGYSLVPSFFVLGPVLLFWGVNRTNLLVLGTQAPAIPARVCAVETKHFRGAPLHTASVEFADGMGTQTVNIQGPDAARLHVGAEVHVLRKGTTAAVLWGPDAFMLARLGRVKGRARRR